MESREGGLAWIRVEDQGHYSLDQRLYCCVHVAATMVERMFFVMDIDSCSPRKKGHPSLPESSFDGIFLLSFYFQIIGYPELTAWSRFPLHPMKHGSWGALEPQLPTIFCSHRRRIPFPSSREGKKKRSPKILNKKKIQIRTWALYKAYMYIYIYRYIYIYIYIYVVGTSNLAS